MNNTVFSGVNLGSQMHVRIFLIYYVYTQLSKMIPLTNNSDNVLNIATDREELTSGLISVSCGVFSFVDVRRYPSSVSVKAALDFWSVEIYTGHVYLT